jgi:hypothetical protein
LLGLNLSVAATKLHSVSTYAVASFCGSCHHNVRLSSQSEMFWSRQPLHLPVGEWRECSW